MDSLIAKADVIYDDISGRFSEDEDIKEFLTNREELQGFIEQHKRLILDYLKEYQSEETFSSQSLYQFYMKCSLPYAVLVKYFNLFKTALKKALLAEGDDYEQKAQITLELDRLFKSHIDLLSQAYIQKEATEYAQSLTRSKFSDFPLYQIHANWIKKIIDALSRENLEGYPHEGAHNCAYTPVMEYPQSLMVCLDSLLCGQLDSTHRTLHDEAAVFYRYYVKKGFAEAYFVFKSLKENSHKFFSLLKDLYYLTYSDLENSFFKLIENYTYSDVKQCVSIIDIVDIKKLNSLHGEQKVDALLEDLQKIFSNLNNTHPERLLAIRGVSADFYILHIEEENRNVVEDLDEICRDVRKTLASQHPDIKVRFSIASFRLDKTIKYGKDELVRILLHLKDRSKQENRRICIFEKKESEEIREWLNKRYFNMQFVSSKLTDHAVDVMFQPIYQSNSRHMFALEALARIKDKEQYLSAGLFIETVYEMGLIVQLDILILEAIERELSILKSCCKRLFINASPQSLNDGRYLGRLNTFLKRAAELNVVMEITEQQALENIETLHDCREKGNITFAIDDFGSGYSSLKTLSKLIERGLVDLLKIDGSLILDMQTKPQSEKIVKIINEMCQTFGILSVAEFVENEATLKKLEEMGTDLLQGYYLAIPMHAAELRTLESIPRETFAFSPDALV